MAKNKKIYIAVAGAVVGAVLLLFGGRLSGIGSSDTGGSKTADEVVQTKAMDTYRSELEKRMEKLCTRVRGVGDVRVAVSLSGGFEYVYASNAKWSSGSSSTEYIVVDDGADEKLVLLYEKVPEIIGIGVVCEGGDDSAVCAEVVQLLSAAFGVGAHNIHVSCGK